MIDLACPKCGRVGSVPREKARSRLVCKACHSVFHMGPHGKPVLGEPAPDAHSAGHAPHGTHHGPAPSPAAHPVARADAADWAPWLGKALAGAAALLVVGGAAALFFSGVLAGESTALEDRAKTAAQALADSDLGKLKTFAMPNSQEDVLRWHEALRPHLEDMKAGSLGNRVGVWIMEMSENRAAGTGTVSVFFIPEGGTSHQKQIAEAAGVARSSRLCQSHWLLAPSGEWMIDGAKTLKEVLASR